MAQGRPSGAQGPPGHLSPPPGSPRDLHLSPVLAPPGQKRVSDLDGSGELRVRVVFGPGCGGRPETDLAVPPGTSLRNLLPGLGLFVEGTALWWDGEPVPSDFRVTRSGRLEVVGTFSGG